MNRKQYNSDTRYAKVLEQMDLLGIMDITTTRQHKNGTVVWRLPIKNHDNRNPSYIKVASFSTGYVRNQNSGYSNYQLNKRCEGEPQYYKCTNRHDGSDLYRKFTTRSCKLIPIEIDRLEYLISYCLKNYYIKRANEVADGKFISKWLHEWELEKVGCYKNEYKNRSSEVNELEEKLDAMTEDRDLHVNTIIKLEEKLVDMNDRKIDLENKLATINRISDI